MELSDNIKGWSEGSPDSCKPDVFFEPTDQQHHLPQLSVKRDHNPEKGLTTVPLDASVGALQLHYIPSQNKNWCVSVGRGKRSLGGAGANKIEREEIRNRGDPPDLPDLLVAVHPLCAKQ